MLALFLKVFRTGTGIDTPKFIFARKSKKCALTELKSDSCLEQTLSLPRCGKTKRNQFNLKKQFKHIRNLALQSQFYSSRSTVAYFRDKSSKACKKMKKRLKIQSQQKMLQEHHFTFFAFRQTGILEQIPQHQMLMSAFGSKRTPNICNRSRFFCCLFKA